MDREFEAFVRDALPSLGRFARSLTGDVQAAEDLLQDTFVRVGTAWPRVRRDGNPVPYAKAVMVNLHISGVRWRRRRTRLPEGDVPSGADDVHLARVDDRDELFRALNLLPPLQRAVLVLGYLDDMDDAGIARIVGRRETTVRSLRRRALATLRSGLGATHPLIDDEVKESG